MKSNAWWVVVVTLVAGIWTFTACGRQDDTPAADPGATDDAGSSGTEQSSSGGAESKPAPPLDGGTSSGGSNGETEPNLKIAFIGDTAAGSNFKKVLELIKRENAAAVMIQGDVTYSGDGAADWFPVIDNEINKAWDGSTATVTIPYFLARGNHDVGWDTLAAGMKDRMTKWGIGTLHNDPTSKNYAFDFKGLEMIMVDQAETANPTRADYVNERLQNDKHIWKICSWHKNQRASNVGPKDDEMGWQIYENCRNQGAIVAQGHSHTYSRSKTLIEDATQKLDPACSSDPFELCVGPGKHFFFDSSLGGVDTRSLDTATAAKNYWGSTYTGSYGALFIEFNVDGDPKKAKGYFKTIGDQVVDPPANSGKQTFTITRSP